MVSFSTLRHSTLVLLGLLLASLSLIPTPSHASSAANLEVSGWIPYWRDSQGMASARKQFSTLDTIYPFAYTVASDGSIRDEAGLSARDWQRFIRDAARREIEIIPTIMWADRNAIFTVLSNPQQRAAHIEVIRAMVFSGQYAGVDIDYENKSAETNPHFSAFLRELKAALGNRILSCTIEARTPPESLYTTIPNPLEYANDYRVIGAVCDRIVIMAYDQQRADILLNRARQGKPYVPVADTDWVRKVVTLALQDLPKEKLVLGIPTYGHHYEVTVVPDWYRDYRRIGALNVPDLRDLAREHRVTPSRNAAGELSFSYLPKDSPVRLSSRLRIPKGTPSGDVVAARALAYANETGEAVTFRLGWYSDAEAMRQKIDLAREFGLRGVSLFKIDGEEDQKVWRHLR
jgi:spore germination protein YaaH